MSTRRKQYYYKRRARRGRWRPVATTNETGGADLSFFVVGVCNFYYCFFRELPDIFSTFFLRAYYYYFSHYLCYYYFIIVGGLFSLSGNRCLYVCGRSVKMKERILILVGATWKRGKIEWFFLFLLSFGLRGHPDENVLSMPVRSWLRIQRQLFFFWLDHLRHWQLTELVM